MDSTDHRSFAVLNDDELDGLVEVVIEQFGSNLDRAQFAEVALTLFEDIAGLETITTKQVNRYVAALWRRYRAKSN
jgi:hypothetical protein